MNILTSPVTYNDIFIVIILIRSKYSSLDVRYLGQWFRAGVLFASVDIKLSPFVPESPCIQEVAVVFNPALHSRVFQNFTWGTLLDYIFS